MKKLLFIVFFFPSLALARPFSYNIPDERHSSGDFKVDGALVVGPDKAFITASTTITASSPMGSTVLFVGDTKNFKKGKFIVLHAPSGEFLDGFDIENVVDSTTLLLRPSKPLTVNIPYGTVVEQRINIDPNGAIQQARNFPVGQWGAFSRFIVNGKEVRLELMEDVRGRVRWRMKQVD